MTYQKSDTIGGFLVVRKINYFGEHTAGKIEERQPAVPLSHEEIFAHYKGFEGQPWPEDKGIEDLNLQRGLASLDRYDDVMAYYQTASRVFLCDLIYLQFTDLSTVRPLKMPNFSFCGYDYGYYLSEFNLYSVLFNEVIYGKHETLRNCAKFLNGHLLIPSLDIAARIDRTRGHLLAFGADLETDETCTTIAIHCLSSG